MRIVNYLIEYLGEFEFETILDYESADQICSFDVKKPPRKSRAWAPLITDNFGLGEKFRLVERLNCEFCCCDHSSCCLIPGIDISLISASLGTPKGVLN